MTKLFWSQNSIEQKFHRLLTEINDSFHDISSLATLRQLEKADLKNEEIFTFLKKIAISHKNAEIRFIVVKLLHKNFPENSKTLIKTLFGQDPNYKIKVLNLSESKRYNFNELVDIGIKQVKNKEKMIEDIFTYNFTEFLLSWKDYSDLFDFYYNTEFKCFICNFKKKPREVAYLCNRASDPFYGLRVSSILSTNKIRYLVRNSSKMRIVMDFFRRFLQVKKGDMKALALRPEHESSLPNVRIFCDIGEFLVYLHL